MPGPTPLPAVTFVDHQGKPHSVDFCERNLNLLAHAQAIELEVGSRCGGHGVCGGDRIRLPVGLTQPERLSPITEKERQHLSSEQLAQGWRLACQCFPEGEFTIECHLTSGTPFAK